MYGFTWKRELLAGSCGSGDQHEANERISQLTRRPHTGTMVAEARGENGSRSTARAAAAAGGWCVRVIVRDASSGRRRPRQKTADARICEPHVIVRVTRSGSCDVARTKLPLFRILDAVHDEANVL